MTGPDLEKPFQDAAVRGEQLEKHFQEQTQEFLWSIFHTEGFALQWVRDWVADPEEALAKVFIASVTIPEKGGEGAIASSIVSALLGLAKPYIERKAEEAEERDDGSDDFEKDSD